LSAAALLLLAQCAPDTGRPADPDSPDQFVEAAVLRTDAPEYRLRRQDGILEAEIGFTFRNETDRPVYVVNCNRIAPPTLEKLDGGQWVRVWEAAVPLCLSPPIVIEPGTTHTDTLHFTAGPRGGDIYPQLGVDDPTGTYRLVWHRLVFDYDEDRDGFGEPVPLEQRVSNRFVFRSP
jgi:hypothetical protein